MLRCACASCVYAEQFDNILTVDRERASVEEMYNIQSRVNRLELRKTTM